MGMTDKQFISFLSSILDDILEVLEKMSDGEEKEKLKKLAYNLQKSIEE